MDVHGDARSGTSDGADISVDAPFEPFRCHRCGERIGVYEPLALADEEGIRVTSRAAESALRDADGIYFHRGCFETDEATFEATRRRSAWRPASSVGPPA
jgi:hypothetical protein